MIPVKLAIKGLYSYREKQEIDFQALMASQLFGIFGAVGSGKSSILEAIMFILFEQSDRLNAKDNRYYNMLNLQSHEMEIDFVFRAGVQSKEQYRFYFSAKRNKNDFEKVEVKDRSYYRWKNDTWTPLAEGDNVVAILGMSYQNFMQTIIIPQGKFKEFIDLTPTLRTRMLRELFHLEKFDLSHKTNALLGKCKSETDRLEGELKGIGEVGQEDIKSLEEEIEAEGEKLKKNVAALKEVEKENQALEQLKVLFQKLEAVQEQLQYLQEQQPFFEAKEKRLANYERAYKFFKEKFTALEEALQQIKQKNAHLEQYKQETLKNEEALKEAEKAKLAAKAAYDNREEVRRKCDELGLLIEIKNLQEKWEEARQAATKAEEKFLWLKKQKETQAKKREEKEQEVIALEKKMVDTKTLYELSHWHRKKQELLQEQEKAGKAHKIHQAEKQKVLSACTKLYNGYNWLSSNLTFEETYKKITVEKQRHKQEEEKLLASLRQLQVQQELANYASALQEDEPCPLCGATHHPKVAHSDSAAKAVQVQEKRLQELHDEMNRLEALEKAVGILESESKLVDTLLEKAEGEQKEADHKLLQHQQVFAWKAYEDKSSDEIVAFIRKTEEQQRTINKLKSEMQVLKSTLETQEKEFVQKQEQYEKVQKIANENEITLRTKKESLRLLPYEKFEKFTTEKLRDNLAIGEKRYKEIQRTYEEKREAVEQLRLTINSLKTRQEAEETHLAELVKKIEKLDRDIRYLCSQEGFASPEEVKQLLDQNLNTETEKQKIDEYKEQLHSVRGSYQQLRKEAENKAYNEHYHMELTYQLKAVRDEVEQQKENLALERKKVADLTEKLARRAKLGKDLDHLKARMENLKEMSSLFRGSGFVNYASHIYLNDLCKAANERFMQLTKNNLSLELNENNDFIVRDYLNDGKTRLLKTLSGGQTFQAALCLALALAENVKSLNQAKQSFFFLDEGFGALDKASLRVVFDTLKSLQKENRIVGVISHVEELQQEIDVFLKVEHDRERGSLIHCSWQ